MSYKILIWNTQHFNNQTAKESVAYQEKAKYLFKVLLLKRPDILALFETGTTGAPNVSAEKLLNSWGYKLVHALDNEGGSRLETTLGSMVFVRDELAGAFEVLPDYVLTESERRAPIIIRHKYNRDALAFYHANSSHKAVQLTGETIRFIVDNNRGKFRELVFFGGDLNAEPHVNHEEIRFHEHKPLRPAPPPTAGTHIQITNKTLKESGRDWKSNVEYVFDDEQGKDVPVHSQAQWNSIYRWDEAITEDEYVATPRVLDYAYVTNTYRWTAECEGRADCIPNNSGGYRAIRRISYGDVVRSDHFPVFYFGKGQHETVMFRIQIAEDPSLNGALRSSLGISDQPVSLRFGSFKSSPVVMEEGVAATYWAWQSAKTLRVSSSIDLTARFQYKKQAGVAWPAIIEFSTNTPSFGSVSSSSSGNLIRLYITAIEYE
jgi:hypothetical protein